MEYSALIFDDCMDTSDSYENLEKTIEVFSKDQNCKQVVVSCSNEWMLKLAACPKNKVMLVKMSDKPYVALLNGLKAVVYENVVVAGLSKQILYNEVEKVLESLSKYPAIYMDKDLQAFDTRLLMFCLQKAIESNFAINSYADAIEKLADTPLQYI